MSGVSKLVRDDEQWSWVTQFASLAEANDQIFVIFPQGVPTDRLVAIKILMFIEDDEGDEVPSREPCIVELYRCMADSRNPWPNNTIPWRVNLVSGQEETIAWTPLQWKSTMDQIGFLVRGPTNLTSVSVSILVRTTFC